jgi:hypothetical protein
MIPNLNKYLKKKGVPIQYVKRLLGLQNLNTARKVFKCSNGCWSRLYDSAKTKQNDPNVLKDRVCDECKQRYEKYMKGEELD